MRFCWEVLPCPNPRCPVRERQIIRCFKYFEPKGDQKKLEITCGDRLCHSCHYQRGWELGILHEGLFEDILERKRIKRQREERIRRQGLVELYLNELSRKPLSREDELALAKKIAGDKDAAELFLMANLKLVVRVASSFTNRGLSLMDLIQEGNIGLIKAISKFDWTLGYRFSTYAAYWIRHYMQQAISDQARVIRVPHHLLAIAHKIRRAINDLQGDLQRPPTLTELSKVLGLEEEKILEVLRVTETPISIEAKRNDDDEEAGAEYYIADRTALSPEEEALEKAKVEACRKALDLLPPRLKEVAEWFYGFREEQLSLAEIGRRMGISRERARQLLAQALEELKTHEFVANMKDFL
ncbi:MAG: RNA polymerase sigma factor RpoD [Candidatus Ozemobacter sibiricus]|uniref:RNA polymerase sigma factor RpoD n=1 Tax=Candidatus Ozemobacter sibiricus TaxID=2268124 RepID=A0A367ZUD0_9BACT|nr:MAG: RNA polymerase sigma factor RpoD [Candidatus Ozemobacter sibiricus]